jgi:hypothetical protein
MSALGQKQTFAVQKRMSALPPKADIDSGSRNVRFVPKADIGSLFSGWALVSRYFVATFTPLRPFASIAFFTMPLCFASPPQKRTCAVQLGMSALCQ